ncbi:MAG TPA: GIY-YIG nuclease family protein [Pyrinomonadaceae bacterium]|nr:excinuclease ABC subunit C [Blastocatellia bacterium]HRJ88596.1 GIY-YIG nuclease family protein [Pyrinomonadaceae bacterium]HRK49463.1 GIY-YIG nuclease family protein [Pyrinomonadaceae bacterium]
MDNKAAKIAYKLSWRPMGVFQIRNTANDKIYVGSSTDLNAIFNRTRFQLFAGAHPNKGLEADWKLFGTGKFEFEILEEIFPREDVNYDYIADLDTLEDLWLEKLQPYGEKGYNERKRSREERLPMIAANRKQ